MNKQEFETLAKEKVTDEEYARIERIYMGAPNVDKEQFVCEYKLHKLDMSETVCDMAEANEKMTLKIRNLKHNLELELEIKSQRANELEAVILDNKKLASEICDLRNTKTKLAAALIEGGMEYQAIEILGRSAVIGLKCAMGYDLTAADKQYIAEIFGK